MLSIHSLLWTTVQCSLVSRFISPCLHPLHNLSMSLKVNAMAMSWCGNNSYTSLIPLQEEAMQRGNQQTRGAGQRKYWARSQQSTSSVYTPFVRIVLGIVAIGIIVLIIIFLRSFFVSLVWLYVPYVFTEYFLYLVLTLTFILLSHSSFW